MPKKYSTKKKLVVVYPKQARYKKMKRMGIKGVRKVVSEMINSTREMKRLDVQVDEKQLTIPGQGFITNNLTSNAIYNYMSIGTGPTNRIGNQIQPVGIDLKGWMRFTSQLASAAQADTKVRLITGYVDDLTYVSAKSSFNSVNWFWNGQGAITTSDYRDITRNLNYHVITPLSDKTYTMTPAPTYNGSTIVTNPGNFTNLRTLRIKHKFGPKEVQVSQVTTENCWQKRNLVILAFVRLASDDLAVPATNLEFVMEGGFYYHDA